MNFVFKCVSVTFFVLLAIATSSPAQTEWQAPAFTDTLKNSIQSDSKSIAEGKKVYENMCWSCHGLQGKGNGPAAAAINPKPADHTSERVQQQKDGNIYWKISTGKGVMQPYGKTLTSKQRWALVSYIRVLGASSNITQEQQQ